MLQVQSARSAPTGTAHIVRQISPDGNRYLTLQDELGSIHNDHHSSPQREKQEKYT
ncbi:MAG: hypothetical protein AAGL17_24680 [Cyanobacteria bacterium J06576_12]